MSTCDLAILKAGSHNDQLSSAEGAGPTRRPRTPQRRASPRPPRRRLGPATSGARGRCLGHGEQVVKIATEHAHGGRRAAQAAIPAGVVVWRRVAPAGSWRRDVSREIFAGDVSLAARGQRMPRTVGSLSLPGPGACAWRVSSPGPSPLLAYRQVKAERSNRTAEGVHGHRYGVPSPPACSSQLAWLDAVAAGSSARRSSSLSA